MSWIYYFFGGAVTIPVGKTAWMTILVWAILPRLALSASPDRYNVVVLTADAFRGDMLGANGNPEIQTPNLDRLAAQSVNFTRAYTSITTTAPSFASLFTSLYPSEHGIYSNTGKISENVSTLPEYLLKKGWHTAAIVNLPWLNPEVSNIAQGIEQMEKCEHIRKADRTNRWVLDFLDSRRGKSDRPFFLWVHYIDNHTPYHAPGKFQRMYYPKNKDPKAPGPGTLQAAWKVFPLHHRDNPFFEKWLAGITDAQYVVAAYKGSVSWLDEQIGRVIDRLKQNQQWEKTLLVFTSDHGESLGEHGLWFLHGGLFEATTKIPLIIRMPGEHEGKTINRVVQQVDIMPTIMARCGLPAPKQVRGTDLWDVIDKESLAGGIALLEHAGFYLKGIVTQEYKYIQHRTNRKIYPSYPMQRGREELYDLTNDPNEEQDLIKKRPDLAKELRIVLKEVESGNRIDLKAKKADIDGQTEEMLRSLGYTQ